MSAALYHLEQELFSVFSHNSIYLQNNANIYRGYGHYTMIDYR